MALDLATRAQQLLLDGARDFPGVEEIGDFELSHDGRQLAFGLRGRFDGAFGLRGAFSGAVTLDLKSRRLSVLTREQACQTTWAPDDRQVLWVETGGSGGTRVMAGSPDGSDRHVFMDLPGAYSHEYFPKLSSDGRWLVWGAAAEGHEHDRADYEIFVWQVGAPVGARGPPDAPRRERSVAGSLGSAATLSAVPARSSWRARRFLPTRPTSRASSWRPGRSSSRPPAPGRIITTRPSSRGSWRPRRAGSSTRRAPSFTGTPSIRMA